MTAFDSEDAILELINTTFSHAHGDVLLGRGDDCAIITAGRNLCVSTDLFLEDVHFRRSYFTPEDIGHKALAVNMSDLAAMGAKPIAFQLALGLPPELDEAWLAQFFKGMAALANTFGIFLSGGDLAMSTKLHIGITVLGKQMEGCALLRRGGSMPGDKIFVIGNLGLARVGFRHLEETGRSAMKDWPQSCEAHLHPQPLIDAGLMLARAGENARPPALMDISDGICRDLPRLLGGKGKLGARLNLPPSTFSEELLRHCNELGLNPCSEACLGGEDYALLGTCAPDMLAALRAALPPLVPIGEVTTDGRVFCNDSDITSLGGFDHFTRNLGQ